MKRKKRKRKEKKKAYRQTKHKQRTNKEQLQTHQDYSIELSAFRMTFKRNFL